jgi:hypothetical protein
MDSHSTNSQLFRSTDRSSNIAFIDFGSNASHNQEMEDSHHNERIEHAEIECAEDCAECDEPTKSFANVDLKPNALTMIDGANCPQLDEFIK